MIERIDGHIHVTKELFPYLRGVRCIANADHPEEYRLLKSVSLPGMTISAGIHPWKADTTPWETMEPVLLDAAVVGEIGLDSVWCSVDMEIQRRIFHRQMELAAIYHKPVILHTKGMEEEILNTIHRYPNRCLVHWYASEKWVEEYIACGCWFTVGPDVESEASVSRLAKMIPVDKILIESDGVDGLAGGQGRELTPEGYREAMERHLDTVAALRGVTADVLGKQMSQNLDRFLHG